MPPPEKTASSRLLTMKFMQRAAAKPTNKPGSAHNSEPSTPTGPPSKRQRLSQQGHDSPSSLSAVHAALAAEEAKRNAALDRAAAEAGETRWVLSFSAPEEAAPRNTLRVVSAGYGELDGGKYGGEEDGDGDRAMDDGSSSDEDDDAAQRVVGRMSFGRKPEPEKNEKEDGEASSSDESEDSERNDDMDPVEREQRKAEARAKRAKKRQAEKARVAQAARQRAGKVVKLNQLSSISNSGGGASPRGSGPDLSRMECHSCGKKGHLMRDCPGRKRGRASLG